MSINMDIIMGQRGTGKSSKLVMRSAMTRTYILTTDDVRARYLSDLARRMNVSIPYPITVREWQQSDKFQGSSILRDGLYIDDLDDVVEKIFDPIPIKAATINEYHGRLLMLKEK